MIVPNSSAKTMLTGLLLIRRRIPLVCVFVLLVGLVVSAPWVVADEAEEITSNMMEGVAPLRSLLAQVHETYPGQILEVELEKEEYGKEDILIYEVKLLTKNGSVLKLEYDAINLELLKLNGRLEN